VTRPRSNGDLLGIARRVADAARGSEAVEAYVSRMRETGVKVHDANVESLVVAERAGVGVRVVVDGRQGFAWAGSLDDAVIDEAVAAARDNAEFATPDVDLGLVTPEEAGSAAAVELDLWRDDVSSTDTADKVALALEAEAATRAADAKVRAVESASYGDAALEAAIATSTGVEASARRTSCSVASFALAGEGSETRTGYGFSAGRAFGDLDVDVAARDAAERSVRLLGAQQPLSSKLPVVLDPLVTRSLLAIIGAALGGEAVVKGRSMFVGRAGEEVAAPDVTLTDDPTDADSFGASTHDSEGVPTRRVDLIVDGVLRGFLHNVYTGRRAGSGTTGSAVRGGYSSTPGVGARALSLTPGTKAQPELFAAAGDALYVQSVSGLHSGTNPVSGDFSVGAEGLMLRDGTFAEPVREMTIASTLPRMLHDIVEVGADLTWLPGGGSGMTLLVDGMTIGGS
jgi:PmbA protein